MWVTVRYKDGALVLTSSVHHLLFSDALLWMFLLLNIYVYSRLRFATRLRFARDLWRFTNVLFD